MKTVGITLLTVALGSASVGPAQAESVGDKLDRLANGTTKVKLLYSVVGVYDDTEQATVFVCTNTARTGGSNAVVAIEIFDQAGTRENDITLGQGVITLPPGRSGLWESSNVAAIASANAAVDFVPSLVNGGSARILSDSKKIICSASVWDTAGNPPTSTLALPVLKKLKQGGQ